MTTGKSICLLLAFLAATSAFSISHTSHNSGRKLFGGYRIVPKVCQPANPSRIKSNDPPICMFNYECSRRKGEVVGACMDGFLFGACCQLPPQSSLEKSPISSNPMNIYNIDHAPNIPILLNPDGSPVGISTKNPNSNQFEDFYTKVPTIDSTTKSQKVKDSTENAEKPQLSNHQAISELAQNYPAVLGQQQILDDLNLPSLLGHSDSNNDIHEQNNNNVNPVTTLLSPDEIMQIADPVDQLPVLFAHGISSNNHSTVDTILLNENGTALNETNNPDELFKPDEHFVSSTKYGYNPTSSYPTSVTQKWSSMSSSTPSSNHQSVTKTSGNTQLYAFVEKLTQGNREKVSMTTQERLTSALKSTVMDSTTPMSSTDNKKDGLVRVPTITHTANKKNDNVLDNEEIAINHIISILNDTSPNTSTKVMTRDHTTPSSTTKKWVTIDETSKPITNKLIVTKKPSSSWPTTTEKFPYTFYSKSPAHSSTYYYYSTASSTESSLSSSYGSSKPSPSSIYTKAPVTQSGTYQSSSSSHTTRPTTNPPAPTVIVLGPLGTEYTTVATQPTLTWKPVTQYNVTDVTMRPTNITKRPTLSTTITHNMSTIISGTSNNHVVSSSYISVNMKEVTTTPSSLKDSDEITSNYQYNSPSTSTKKPTTFWTTISSWSEKPSFHLKPVSQSTVWSPGNFVSMNTIIFKEPPVTKAPISSSSTSPCVEETTAPLDFINFPPVRHPELNTTQQEKPTVVDTGFNNTRYPGSQVLSDSEIPTPTFVEDDVLTNKVDVFVNKIVESLQGNFQTLKDVVYNKKNGTTVVTSPSTGIKKPSTPAPVKKPTAAQQITTRRPPAPTRKPTARPTATRPASPKPTTPKRPSSIVTTKKPPSTSKKPKPTRRPAVTILSTEPTAAEANSISTTVSTTTTEVADLSTVIPPSDFRAACGIRPHMKSGRIVGGKGAKFGEWPWQVLVREATWLGLFTKNKCGGVLITDKYVITAAHCQPGFLASLVAVFGEYDISGELESKRSVTKNVRRVIVNRGYDAATFENDLALLELESPIQFDTHIVPICMPDDGADFTGQWATVTGWGRLKYNGGVPSVLQEVQVPIMENSVCQEMFQTAGHSKLILDSFLCAGFANGQKDSCEGDSGGPLTIQRADGRWILVGTVSHGIKCAAPYLPGVYMRTTYFKPWLHSITGV